MRQRTPYCHCFTVVWRSCFFMGFRNLVQPHIDTCQTRRNASWFAWFCIRLSPSPPSPLRGKGFLTFALPFVIRFNGIRKRDRIFPIFVLALTYEFVGAGLQKRSSRADGYAEGTGLIFPEELWRFDVICATISYTAFVYLEIRILVLEF